MSSTFCVTHAKIKAAAAENPQWKREVQVLQVRSDTPEGPDQFRHGRAVTCAFVAKHLGSGQKRTGSLDGR
jgi:hypothetical protein